MTTIEKTAHPEVIMVREAQAKDARYAEEIAAEMESSAKARGTGIAKRSPDYLAKKMAEGKAVIALLEDGTWVGFCYIEAWGHEQFVANSGLIVAPAFRKTGVATQIKRRIFNLSRLKYPNAKIFGLTTGLAVMKMNSELGYVPVTYSELTDDEEFWQGCKSCVNFEILTMKGRKNCLCTGMLYDPAKAPKTELKPAQEIVIQRNPNDEGGVEVQLISPKKDEAGTSPGLTGADVKTTDENKTALERLKNAVRGKFFNLF